MTGSRPNKLEKYSSIRFKVVMITIMAIQIGITENFSAPECKIYHVVLAVGWHAVNWN